MKKIKLFYLVFCLTIIISYNANWAIQKLTSKVLVSPTKIYPSYIKTPQDIEDWFIKEGFKYIPDRTRKDEWKTPEHTVKDKGGDCEDYSVLTKYILEDLGYGAMIVAIYGKDLAHGICWFKEKDGTWSYFSSGIDLSGHSRFYWPCKTNNVFNILYEDFPEWEKIQLCTPNGYSIYQVNRKDLERRQL